MKEVVIPPELMERARELSDLQRWLRNWTIREGDARRGLRRRIERFHRWADALEASEQERERLSYAVEIAARDDCGPKTTKRILRAALSPTTPEEKK